MKLNFKQKIVFPVLILIILGLGALGFISSSKAKNALKNSITEQIVTICGSTLATMDSWVVDRTQDIATWSTLEICQTALKDSFVGKAARKNINNMFGEWRKSYGYYEGISLADLSGEIIAGFPTTVIGKINIGTREYFKGSMAGEISLSPILISKNSGNPIFVISAPIKGKSGVEGVLFAVVDLMAFSKKFTDSITIGEKGYGYIIDDKGMVVAHPDKTKINHLDLKKTDYGRKIINEKNGYMAAIADGKEVHNAFRHSAKLNAMIVVQSDDEEIFAPITAITRFTLITSVLVTLLAAGIVWVIAGTIVRPINAVVAGLKDAAEGEGDLTKRLDVKSSDEVGELARWFNEFAEKVQIIIKDVADNARRLTTSSGRLSEIAMQMTEGAANTSQKTNSAASSTKEVSENMNAVAAAMEQATTNIHMISSATEEMTATINEIAANSEKGRGIALDAVEQTEKSSVQMKELGKAALEIDEVVETITDISEQVNLLSLNATIEAARAGEAGKGFAVVANEIKELARQTAGATGEIKERAQNIQASTENTISQIDKISSVVKEVSDINSTIAAAVEEQSATTKEIAENVSQVSLGINEVNENIAHTNTVSSQISQEITDISQSTSKISQNSEKVSDSASGLADLADTLSQMVGRFKI
ncbi:methyl-accepting chemotaxis protein [Desulfospira joergensenii]|uniref:methyl-accepting chemotaxis protein n=1 Tax=Desulfospira joergensenii TaxID=53329 RepID=UPI0003B2F59E|nr:methyl-accepting chemotaxis protein [Desulfospira joergensenii]